MRNLFDDENYNPCFIEQSSTNPVHFITGTYLADFCEDALALERRDIYYDVESFINKERNLRTVGIVYGMRSTGKTVILRQLAGRKDYLQKSAYVSIGYGKTLVEDIYVQIKMLYEKGVRHFYIDEVTWASGFIDRAMEFADVWAAFKGVRIVLSGTDSLAFTFAMQESLYGRYKVFYTTPMGYPEYHRLVGKDFLAYARSGGVFWDSVNVIDYIRTSVVSNIYNSISGLQRQILVGEDLRYVSLQEIYAMCYSICLAVAQRYLYDHLRAAWDNPLLKVVDSALRNTGVQITRVQKQALSTSPLFTVETTLYDKNHIDAVLELMRRIGFLVDFPLITDSTHTTRPMFSQTGVAHEFTLEAIRMISQDASIPPSAVERLEENADGALLEIGCFVTLANYASKHPSLALSLAMFRDKTGDNEIDIIVYCRSKKTLYLHEVKRSDVAKTDYSKHLVKQDLVNYLMDYYGAEKIDKAVLYRGKDTARPIKGDDISYYHLESFFSKVECGEVFVC